jgi:DNA-binding transcriptional LysR family regulator
LFARTTRQVTLTAAGEALIPGAREVVAAAETALAPARAAAAADVAPLTLGVTRSAHAVGAAVVQTLEGQRGTLSVDVRYDFAPALERRLLAGELDLAVVFCPARCRGLRRQRLANLPAVCTVAARHPLAGRPTITIEELADQTFAIPAEWMGPGLIATMLGLCRAAGFEPKTASAEGYMAPSGIDPAQTVGITAELALDGVPHPYEVRAIPIPNRTLPVDLLWRAGSERRAVLTAVKVARELHRRYLDARDLVTAGLT